MHAPALRALRGARVVAVADPHAEHREATAAMFDDAAALADHEALLARADVDAVVVALPTAQHAAAGIATLLAGKHLYLEKPIATTLADASRLVQVWRATTLVGMMGFNYRHNPLHLRLRDEIRRGAIGDVVSVRTVFGAAPYELPAWKTRRATGGGVLLDFAVHHVDLLRFLLDREVVSVQAEVMSARTEGDRAALQLVLDGGVLAQMHCAFGAVDEDRVEVYGTTGKLTVDRFHSIDAEWRPSALGGSRLARLGVGRRGPSLASFASSPVLAQRLRVPTLEPSFARSIESFVVAVAARRQTAPDLADGMRALAVVDAAERSAVEGRRIAVSSVA